MLREALALLDDEGFDALTMRRLAERLGVVPMALYRHVANKDDLIIGVIDLAVSLVPIPSADLDWRGGLHELAHSIRRTMLQHPGIVGPVVTQPALGVHTARDRRVRPGGDAYRRVLAGGCRARSEDGTDLHARVRRARGAETSVSWRTPATALRAGSTSTTTSYRSRSSRTPSRYDRAPKNSSVRRNSSTDCSASSMASNFTRRRSAVVDQRSRWA